jgi:DNA mismatch repair protein MutS
MMDQYLRIKSKFKDTILFFRMGDFYEMFFEDAKIASQVLGLTLTTRNHGQQDKTPLAGIPYHAVDTYLARFIKAGYKVAICEQTEDPKMAKGLVKREVTEVVTPGTTFSDKIIDSNRNNFLAACAQAPAGATHTYGLALVDLTTGEFMVTEGDETTIVEELVSVGPAELVAPAEWAPASRLIKLVKDALPNLTLSTQADWLFSRDHAYAALIDHFQVASLKGFGCEDFSAGIAAAGGVLAYLKENQKNSLPHLKQLRPFLHTDHMVLDPSTQANLELVENAHDNTKHGTLLSVLDRTKTPLGARLVRQWLLRPLLSAGDINARLDAVQALVTDHRTRQDLQETLRGMGDLERLMAKICCNRANARDLMQLKTSLSLLPELRQGLAQTKVALLAQLDTGLTDTTGLVPLIAGAIADEPPLALNEGGLIRAGHNAELDDLRNAAHSGKDWIARLQIAERERTQISSLKVEFNNVFGYYIEVTKTHLAKVPPEYIRKQTLANCERYYTPELKEFEDKILHAEERGNDLEYRLFQAVRERAAAQVTAVQTIARAVAQLDVLASLADCAAAFRYVRPNLSADDAIVIKDGRHPVVERLLADGNFVPNDLDINNIAAQVLIITGPNMAGKSTYLRQVGQIVLMAQVGSFVPAAEASIGIVDRIFTRVGASDNLARGESTFLVEMNETANILNNATARSLVLLDEIGRGTSTFDGLSIAWAVTEHLHNQVHAKTLFATHYHELTEMELILPRVKNYSVLVKEFNDHIVFLRKIAPGGCDSSYGVQVARLAGLPPAVIVRAKEVLHNLEANELTPNREPKLAQGEHAPVKLRTPQLDLFTVYKDSPVVAMLKELDVDKLTPIAALNALNDLKKALDGQ